MKVVKGGGGLLGAGKFLHRFALYMFTFCGCYNSKVTAMCLLTSCSCCCFLREYCVNGVQHWHTCLLLIEMSIDLSK